MYHLFFRSFHSFLCLWGLLLSGGALWAQVRCPDLIEEEWVIVAGDDCADLKVCLPVAYGELVGFGVQLDGQPLSQPLAPCNFDSSFVIGFASLPGGGLAGPYTLVDWTVNGISHTVTFSTIAELVGWMNTWDPTGEWKLEMGAQLITGGHPSNSYGSLQIQQGSSGILSVLSLNASLVPTGARMTAPQGVHQLIFEELATGCRDTLYLAAGCPEVSVMNQVVGLNDTSTLCFSAENLAGQVVSLTNFCPEEGGEFATMEVQNDTCIVLEGLEEGVESACIQACDGYGICDTFFLNIQVIDLEQSKPLAVDDTLVLFELDPLPFQVLANDLLPGGVKSVYLVDHPHAGQAMLSPQGVLLYTPPEFDCEQPFTDELTYGVCTPYGCDTARVLIRGLCVGPRVYNGFSPNGDGVNDFFRIGGLNRYGPNTLWIFNRWGEVVFYATDYQNDWDGTWKGRPLSVGTYFYLLEFGAGQRQSGYLQLER
ncbi:MAG: gliding motility-associated C-terminal domain-containing protein [Lewinellaceae bacterium]|nr:gliding motility-associated C-terminal domain-containing protein [Lewinellaceae bacterium]